MPGYAGLRQARLFGEEVCCARSRYGGQMTTGRMKAFSDGVIAILVTVMVLELPIPHGTNWAALCPPRRSC